MSLEQRAELSMDEYRAAAEKGFVVPEAETTDATSTETASEPESIPETETEADKPAEESKEAPVEATSPQSEEPIDDISAPDDPRGVKKRIGKALEREREAKARAEALEAELQQLRANRDGNPPQETPAPRTVEGKPKLDDFDSVEEFTDALTDWKLAQREQAQKAQEQAKTTTQKIEAAAEKYPDFNEVAFSPQVIKAIEAMPALGNAITESPIFADLAMHLGTNIQELQRLSKMPVVRAIAELGKIEAKLQQPQDKPTPKPPAPALPPPAKPVGGKSATSAEPTLEDMAEMPYLQWKRLRQARA